QSDVARTQIEIPCKQRFDVLRLVALLRRLIHFHDSAELLIAAFGGFAGQNEVRVILDAHGAEAYRRTPSDVCDWLHSLRWPMLAKMRLGSRAAATLLTYFSAPIYRGSAVRMGPAMTAQRSLSLAALAALMLASTSLAVAQQDLRATLFVEADKALA